MTTSELLQRPVRPAPRAKTIEPPPPDTGPPAPAERRGDPKWARPALFVLLAVTAAAYLWDLSASGYANSFYAAAVQAGTKSWKAFFFGSIDASNFITVDKPPASLWVMEFSGRIFGFSSWSMLVPQALEGVAAVGLLYATIKRWFGAGAGLIAGALFAATPVAALMFRFNNPDALLVLLLDRQRLLPDTCARACRDSLGPGRRRARRRCVPGEDDAGVPRAAGFRDGLCDRRADDASPAPAAAARRRRRAPAHGRLVGARSSRSGRSARGR